MKRLIIVNGTMGVGKTAVCRELQKLLPKNVFLDGDWCWYAKPFAVTEETKAMVMENIAFLLNSFLRCGEYENVIFCWVLDEQETIDGLLSTLRTEDAETKIFTLTAREDVIRERLMKDVRNGFREEEVIRRSLEKLPKYEKLRTEKIDTSKMTVGEAAEYIKSAFLKTEPEAENVFQKKQKKA